MRTWVPLSKAAQDEARRMMLSTANLLSPSDGGPVVAPTQEIFAAVERVRAAGKPVVASMGSVAASGGYFVAMPASVSPKCSAWSVRRASAR